jgi:[ribosomal protein S5]-alanine N-acetyltransferase
VLLTTQRLVLREFEETDCPAVLAYQSDPLYVHCYRWTHRTEQDVREFVQMFMARREE